jgi:hypothetical protein
MIAMGIIECEDALRSLVETSVRLGCKMEPSVIRTSFAIRLNGAVPLWTIRRSKADRFIRYQIKSMLGRWAGIPDIEHEAVRINDGLGQPLLYAELEWIMAELLGEFVMRQSRTGGRRV